MKFFVKQSILALASMSFSVFANGDLVITNTTLGLLRFTITRGTQIGVLSEVKPEEFLSAVIPPGEVYIRRGLLVTGDKIDFRIADNTVGPVLPTDYIVGNRYSRTSNVTITCKSDSCDIQED